MDINLKILATTEFLFKLPEDNTYCLNYLGDYIKLIGQATTTEPPFRCVRFEAAKPIHMKHINQAAWDKFKQECYDKASQYFTANTESNNGGIPPIITIP